MSSFARVIPFKNPILWKGAGLGVVACVLALAVLIPNLLRTRMSARTSNMQYAKLVYSGADDTYSGIVQADGPKIVRKAQLDLLVGNCAETQKKIEKLSAEESGFVESSTLEENSARLTIRV